MCLGCGSLLSWLLSVHLRIVSCGLIFCGGLLDRCCLRCWLFTLGWFVLMMFNLVVDSAR